jgi:hypothetical protein
MSSKLVYDGVGHRALIVGSDHNLHSGGHSSLRISGKRTRYN